MAIVKKTNGNLLIDLELTKGSAPVKMSIQPDNVSLYSDGRYVAVVKDANIWGYINTGDVGTTQIEPAAAAPFTGNSDALVELLCGSFLAASTATDSEGWIEATVVVSQAQLANMGFTAGTVIELLPASGAGKYYEYLIDLKGENGNSIAAGTADFIYIGSEDYGGNIFEFSAYNSLIDKTFQFSSRNAVNFTDGTNIPVMSMHTNQRIIMTTWNGNNPGAVVGDCTVEIKYRLKTF